MLLTLLLVYIRIVLEKHICLSKETHLSFTIYVIIGSNFSKKIEDHVVGTALDIRFGLVADDTSAASDAHAVHDYNTININKVIIYICFMWYCLGVSAHLLKCRYVSVNCNRMVVVVYYLIIFSRCRTMMVKVIVAKMIQYFLLPSIYPEVLEGKFLTEVARCFGR